jgi:hypothetical protein
VATALALPLLLLQPLHPPCGPRLRRQQQQWSLPLQQLRSTAMVSIIATA